MSLIVKSLKRLPVTEERNRLRKSEKDQLSFEKCIFCIGQFRRTFVAITPTLEQRSPVCVVFVSASDLSRKSMYWTSTLEVTVSTQ